MYNERLTIGSSRCSERILTVETQNENPVELKLQHASNVIAEIANLWQLTLDLLTFYDLRLFFAAESNLSFHGYTENYSCIYFGGLTKGKRESNDYFYS